MGKEFFLKTSVKIAAAAEYYYAALKDVRMN